MSDKLTRRGARNVTAIFDRMANLVQAEAAILGVDPKIAFDFAERCDMMSDAVERTAMINFPKQAESEAQALKDDADPKSDDLNTRLNSTDGPKMAANEEGMSVPTPGWDADQIADKVPGPQEKETDEPYMATFNEEEFHELGERVEGNGLENGAKAASPKMAHGFDLFA